MAATRRLQLHLDLAYKHEVAQYPKVHTLLGQGWRIVDVQRATDRDALVTLERPEPGDPPRAP